MKHMCIYSLCISTKIPFSMHHVKIVMWCDGTHIILHCDHKTPFDETNNLKVAYTIHKVWSTVVWPKLPKFITNSKLLKIFWNPVTYGIVSVSIIVHENNKLENTIFLYNNPPHSQSWSGMSESIMYKSTPINY